jgi:hypothetical protein
MTGIKKGRVMLREIDKRQHWRGVSAIFVLATAPVLEFCFQQGLPPFLKGGWGDFAAVIKWQPPTNPPRSAFSKGEEVGTEHACEIRGETPTANYSVAANRLA